MKSDFHVISVIEVKRSVPNFFYYSLFINPSTSLNYDKNVKCFELKL
jgi:hypothetical protein